ncbi:unnamed protein product, partial [Symbiodinium necroappetens]
TESLVEYEERLRQGVEMARPDCRDEAISVAESCLGEAQFQTAYSRFSNNLCRTTPAAARPDGPDHVLRAIGAGISKLLQMPGADPVAVYYRYKGAADAYAEAGGTDPSGRVQARLLYLFVRRPRFRRRDPGEEAPPAPDYFAEAGGVGPIREEPKSRSRSRDPASWEERYQQYRATMPDEQASAAPSLRAHLPEKALPHHYDLASSGPPSGQDSALLAIVQEMRRQREQDAKERAEQLKSMREEKSVFTYSLRDDLPVFGDGDSDLDKHLEAFSDVCMVVKPKGDREKLRLFARTLKGTRRRCYGTIIKEAKHNGDYESKPASVFDRVVAALDASFHESDEAKAMKARARYDSLEKRATQFQEFQVSWLEALTELNSAGVYKCQKDLLYDYLRKIGSFLRDEVSRDRRFWPLRPSPGVKQEFRGVENWKAAEKRGESEALLAEFGRTGAVCNLCAAVGIKDAANTQQDASQTLTAKEKKAAKKKEKEKAGAVVYDSSLQVAEPATRQWRHWPGSLAKVPKDLKTVAAAPSPGYNAQTRTSCAGVELVTLLDSGATCGSLPEWLFAEIYERTAADVAKGFKKGTAIETKFYVILRLLFTPVGKGFPGVVLGLPTIGPKGLQHHVTDAGHRFDKLGLTLPRLELQRETFLTDLTELRVEASLCAALETEVTLESNQVPVAEGPEVAFGHFDPDLSREGMVVMHNSGPLARQWEAGDVVAAGKRRFLKALLGVVGTATATKHWPQTATYLNGYLKGRCEDAGVAAESWNSLAVSFTGDMPLHRELWVEDAEAVKTQHRALVKFDARVQHGVLPHTGERTSVVAYSIYLLDEPLSRLTFCSHSGQLLERCFAPMEFLEFTDPTDTLTVFIHEDFTKASAFAEMQLGELGFDLEANRCGENLVAEGYLVDLCRGSTPGDCSPEFANHLVEDESLVDSILNDEVPTEAYYQAYRAFLHDEFPQARVCVLEHIAELVELCDLCICIGFSLGIDKLVLLKEFLGTANYSRDQIGPKFAVAMDPLRRYLREGDKAFPMTPRGLEAVERLKRFMRKATCLAVPDERAAAIMVAGLTSSLLTAARQVWGELISRCPQIFVGGTLWRTTLSRSQQRRRCGIPF